MRPTQRKKGFALLIVVILLGVMGLGIAVWASQTKDLMIQTKLQTAQAGLDNAIASAAQWSQINSKTLKNSPMGQIVSLDLGPLQIPELQCQYRVVNKDAHRTEIEITAISNLHSHTIRKTVRLTL
jgi:type II secretory pathway pseudopilin PulG